jgi:microcystin-dependent protein
MADPFLAEIRIFSFGFAPRGWAQCNGQLLPINQNQALFSLLGTTYGGDGRVNFALPNLQGRSPVSTGSGMTLGQSGGEQAHTLTAGEMPTHTHVATGSATPANLGDPTGNLWAAGNAAYHPSPITAMNPASIVPVGGSQAHLNMSPFFTLNFCIALQGIYPSRS